MSTLTRLRRLFPAAPEDHLGAMADGLATMDVAGALCRRPPQLAHLLAQIGHETAGLTRFDAGAQGEHKLVRGFEPVLTRSWHYLCHPGLRAAVADFLVQERAAVQNYAEQAREALPYRQV